MPIINSKLKHSSLLIFTLLLLLSPHSLFANIQDLTYPSKLNNQDIPIKVYTPPGYEKSKDRYPVVYNLHGGGGSPERQWDRTRSTLTKAMDNQMVRPMIYVYVNGLGNTVFANTAEGKLIERSIIEELIPFIDSKFRTVASKEGRLVDGFSMGGFGCLMLAFRNPDKFSAVTSYGAALSITYKSENKNFKNQEHFEEYNPWSLIKKNRDAVRKGVRIRMVCGDSDGLYESNLKFKELLDSLDIPVDWVPVQGVAHCTQCLYEEAGIDSLKFFEESLSIAAKGRPMNVPVKRSGITRSPNTSVSSSTEPIPFRPSGRLPRLKVSDNGRFLVTEDGRPFFWLGDTAWMLFQKLNREEVDKYFEDRAAKQFSIVLAHILPWQHGDTNIYGEPAFEDNDFTRPNEKYWKHADYIVEQAAAKALYIGILPMWGLKYIERKGMEPLVNVETAYSYGKFLGLRYGKKKHIVWILGGDAAPKHTELYDALAKGITEGAGGDPNKVLISYHPPSNVVSSGEFFHDRNWLDFNMIQSGHGLWSLNYQRVEADYNRKPTKPTLDAEPNYENHPIKHSMTNGLFNDWHVRMKAYWSVFAGGFGITYGGNGIWQMDKEGMPPFLESHYNLTWDKALNLPGATQMRYLRRLIESRPFLSRIPDDGSVTRSTKGAQADRIQVTRGIDRTWAMYYLTTGQNLQVNIANLKGPVLKAWWYNPRDGKTYDNDGKVTDKPFTEVKHGDKGQELNPPGEPGEGNDWVLVLDNSLKNYPAPGQPITK
jgi:enterochelin esterase-like enzyme